MACRQNGSAGTPARKHAEERCNQVEHSRADLFEIYNRASVLVLPTLYEGFALVITEAMAHGLSVITTPNSGAGGFITHGREGLIVPDTKRGTTGRSN